MSENDTLVVNDDQSILANCCNDFIKNKLLIIFCVIIAIITGSSQAILIPLCTLYIPSPYFILLGSIIEINIIFTIIMAIYYFKFNNKIFKIKMEGLVSMIFAGIFCFFMCLIKIYTSNPNKTSPIMQSTLSATTLIFSVIFRKLLLNKSNSYNYIFVIISAIAITASVLMPLIYEIIIFGINTSIL